MAEGHEHRGKQCAGKISALLMWAKTAVSCRSQAVKEKENAKPMRFRKTFGRVVLSLNKLARRW